jgi:hypothetical protein
VPRAGEVLAVLRGPLPSCDVRAQRRIDAKAGTNAVRLTRVIRPRRAVPGHYLFTVYVDSLPKVRRVVGITRNRARLLGTAAIEEALALCTARSGLAAALGDGPDGAAGGPRAGAQPSSSPTSPVSSGPSAETPRAKVLSFLDVDPVDSLHPAIAAVIALALLAMLLAAIGGMAAFFRGRARSA